jgi:hypothetical protein
MTFLAQRNYPILLFLEQDIAFFDDDVPIIDHMSALSLSTGDFRRAHDVYFTVTHFHQLCSPFSLYQKISPSIGFCDW